MTSQSQLSQEMNEHIPIRKPIRQSYIANGAHKKNSKRICNQISQRWEKCTMNKEGDMSSNFSDKNKQYQKKFNFKKTTGKKFKYSCGGYGGKCGMCGSSNYGEGKKHRKINIDTKSHSLIMTVNTRNTNI